MPKITFDLTQSEFEALVEKFPQLAHAKIYTKTDSQSARARALINEVLQSGPLDADSMLFMAEQEGISAYTLARVKREMRVHSERRGFGKTGKWVWSL